MTRSSKLTAKSQVTIPKDVREVLGVGPGARIRFEIGAGGRVELKAADGADERALRKAEYLKRLSVVSRDFRAHDPLPGMDGVTYQRMMRGDGSEI